MGRRGKGKRGGKGKGRGREDEREGAEGENDLTHPLLQIPGRHCCNISQVRQIKPA